MKSARSTTRNYYGNRMTHPPSEDFRVERDTLGEMRVPKDALWGARTERARQAFKISGLRPYPAFVRGVVIIKKAAALSNAEAGRLSPERREAPAKASISSVSRKVIG